LRRIDARVDLIESLTLVDDRTFLEQALQDHPGYLRTDVGRLKGGDSAREFLLDRSAALLDDDITDLGRPSSATAAAATLAAAG
jgi:hypothetical protein